MALEHKPGNLYWSNHAGDYLLCVGNRKKRIIAYPYYCLEAGDSLDFLRFDSDNCYIVNLKDEESPLERCCIDFMGKVGKDHKLQPAKESPRYNPNLIVGIPKKFSKSL